MPINPIQWMRERSLTDHAKQILEEDRAGLPLEDPGADKTILACANWLLRAQEFSASMDGGVARDFSLLKGWASSYPETTGYIIPSLLAVADHCGEDAYRESARKMLDWLCSIQFPDGGFQGGTIDAESSVPVTFNTGQILLGLAAGQRQFGAYEEAMHRAAIWLRDSQDKDGAWRKHATSFAQMGDKAYETHVSWGLFEAERIAPDNGYGAAGLRQVDWALSKQRDNGWVEDCCLNMPERPLTHTLGYYLKGVVEAHRLSRGEKYLDAARLMGRGLLTAQRKDGALPGRLSTDWSPAVKWSCLTGNAQIADSWFYLFEQTQDKNYLNAARSASAFVRRTVKFDGDKNIIGGVKGSFPVDGDYGKFEYLNWAAKFLIDACLHEISLNTKSIT